MVARPYIFEYDIAPNLGDSHRGKNWLCGLRFVLIFCGEVIDVLGEDHSEDLRWEIIDGCHLGRLSVHGQQILPQ